MLLVQHTIYLSYDLGFDKWNNWAEVLNKLWFFLKIVQKFFNQTPFFSLAWMKFSKKVLILYSIQFLAEVRSE